MAEPFVAEIRIFAGNFAPSGWALSNGQILPISQNTALFALLGTNYGGDGKSNFGLPNLQGATPLHSDQYTGPDQYPIGITGGSPTVTLQITEMPSHNHGFEAGTGGRAGDVTTPTNGAVSSGAQGDTIYSSSPPSVSMSAVALGPTGLNLPRNNLMPYLVVTFCIALQGVFPPRA